MIYAFIFYICIPSNRCPDGGIGRRAGLKHLWETVPVRLRLRVLTGLRPKTLKGCSLKSSPFCLTFNISKHLVTPYQIIFEHLPYSIWSNYGLRFFELSNHLGNVMAVVSDSRLQSGGTYEPDVINSNDYYAF